MGLEKVFNEVAALQETEPGLCKVKRGRGADLGPQGPPLHS